MDLFTCYLFSYVCAYAKLISFKFVKVKGGGVFYFKKSVWYESVMNVFGGLINLFYISADQCDYK